MIVADTNLIAYLLIEGEFTETARLCARRDSDWIAPPIWRHELLNVLASTVRTGAIDRGKSLELFDLAVELITPPERVPTVASVIDWSTRHALATYDAEFVVLAQETGTRVVTADRRLISAAGESAIHIADFARDR